MLIKCGACFKSFDKAASEIRRTRNHFCTRSCAAQFNNKGIRRKTQKQRMCKSCGTPYTNSKEYRSVAFCKACRDARENPRELTIGEYRNKLSVRGKHPSWLHSHIRILNQNWNKDLRTQCQMCGYSKHVELAHIKAITRFDDSAKLAEVNSPQNLLVLCRNCHWEFDNGLLSVDSIPNRV